MFDPSFKIDTIALFDTAADLNCIKEGTVPVKIDKKPMEGLMLQIIQE